MTIASVFQAGVNAIQSAQASQQRSAHQIANAVVTDPSLNRNAAALAPTQIPATDADDAAWSNRRTDAVAQPSESLEESLINLQVQSYLAAASTKLVKTADQLVGTLLDTRA